LLRASRDRRSLRAAYLDLPLGYRSSPETTRSGCDADEADAEADTADDLL
jgi:hypothetical protein